MEEHNRQVGDAKPGGFASAILKVKDLSELFHSLQSGGWDVFGPKVQDQTIVLESLTSFDDLPLGYRDDHQPGSYRLESSGDGRFFGYTIGAQSLKKIFHPPERQLWSVEKKASEMVFTQPQKPVRPVALFGIRSCDVAALGRLERVFAEQPQDSYSFFHQRLKGRVIVTATCLSPNQQCFCHVMETGPQCQSSDIDLVEVLRGNQHYFVATAHSPLGQDLLNPWISRPLEEVRLHEAQDLVARARRQMTKSMASLEVQRSLVEKTEHPHWQEVADRCLSCANCTMVCPTCFCTTVEDTSDLTGEHSERWLRWDSCFNADFSYLHGGAIRQSPSSRYRQWLTHKLSTWHEQFDQSGCVGCGRCITWCPVGIDLTEELKILGEEP